MALDPFTLVYDALWDMLETHAGFHDKVKLGNRIKFSSYGPMDPIKHEVATADIPEVRLVCIGGTPHLQRASGVSFVNKRFEVQVNVNDLRYTEELFPLEWEIYRAMSKWEATLNSLMWPEQTNKVTNPGFETASPFTWVAARWRSVSPFFTRDVSRKRGGLASLKLIHAGIEDPTSADQYLVLSPSTVHRVQVPIWIPSGNVPSGYVRVALEGYSNPTYADANLTLTDRWQLVKIASWNPGVIGSGNLKLKVNTLKTNLLTQNDFPNQSRVFMHWNGLDNGLLRFFPLDGDVTDWTLNADGTNNGVSWYAGKFNPNYLSTDTFRLGYQKVGVFDGTADYVDCGSAADIDDLTSFSFAAWIKVTAKGNNRFLIDGKDRGGGGWYCELELWTGDNVGLFSVVRCATSAATGFANRVIPLNTWTHVAMVYDDSTKRITHYINGVANNHTTVLGVGARSADAAYTMNLGARQTGAATWEQYFPGYMADVGMWNRALSATEITFLAMGKNATITGLRAISWTGGLCDLVGFGSPPSLPQGHLHGPSYIALAPDCSYYWVPNHDAYCVDKFSMDGQFMQRLGTACGYGDTELAAPYAVALDASENVYVCDDSNTNPRIKVYSKDGTFLRKWPASGTGSGDGQFAPEMWALCVHGNYVYVVDKGNHRIQKFDLLGTFITKWGTAGVGDETRGDSEFYDLRDIQYGPDGTLWVTDRGADGYYNFLKNFTLDGTFIKKWYIPAGHCNRFALDSDGYGYFPGGTFEAACTIQKRLLSTGALIATWGGVGATEGLAYSISGAAITSSDILYVTDWLAHKVEKWTLNGVFVGTNWGGCLYDSDQSLKLIENSGVAKQFYQTKTLAAGTYAVSFLAYTTGAAVTSADVQAFADSGGFVNEILETTFEHVGSGVYLCRGQFTATAGDWNIGIQIEANKTAYVAYPSCFLASAANLAQGIAYFDEVTVEEVNTAKQFVKLARPTNIDVGVSSADLARGARGWMSVWACEVEMWFATADLQT